MPSVRELYRGSSVRIFGLDRERVLDGLRRRARTVLESRPEVLEVRLFGSLARDKAGPGSDADIFITVRDGAGRFLDRIPDLARHFGGLGIGCDVIVHTESERAALVKRRDAFARAVFEQGILLACRDSDS